VLGIVAAPEPGGRTATAVAGLLAGAAKVGASTSLCWS
jgi:FMN reductase